MDQYQDIRHMYLVEGMSQRAIAKQLGISRNTVRRYCKGEQVPWERKLVLTQGDGSFVQLVDRQDSSSE